MIRCRFYPKHNFLDRFETASPSYNSDSEPFYGDKSHESKLSDSETRVSPLGMKLKVVG
jgi:hypothetical protein